VELPASLQLLMAESKIKDQDLAEGSPDRLGAAVDTMEAADTEVTPASGTPASTMADVRPSPETGKGVVPTALREREPLLEVADQPDPVSQTPQAAAALTPAHLPSSGTVVLDVEQGGIVVPSFVGKSVRSAIEIAEQSGLDLEAIGSGAAVGQNPIAGSHVAAGTTVTVKFGR
jgi:hypothetical protein